MKKIINLIILILATNQSLLAQPYPGAIKLLVKDKVTGASFYSDTMLVIINDSIKKKFVTDTDGYILLKPLTPGKYSIGVSHIGYQGSKIWRIMVGEAKTSYITLELSNGEGEKIKKKKKGGVKLKMVKN